MHYILKSKAIFDTEKKETFSGGIEIKDGYITAVYQQTIPTDRGCDIIDCGSQMIIPSFIDAHVHFYLASLVYNKRLTVVSGRSPEEVAKQAETLPIQNGWRIGIGWYASDFGQQVYPTRWQLDATTHDIPTLLISGDAHTIWLNSAGMNALNITPETLPKEITGERFYENNVLTGVFLEAIAIYYLAKVLEIFHETATEDCLMYMKQLNQMGITGVGDVALTGESPDDLVYPHLYAHQQATVRINFFPAMREETQHLDTLSSKYTSPMLQMSGVKQFFDGVTSSHTALLKEPYANPYHAHDVGIPLIPIEKMRRLIHLANQKGFPIRIHAIGDKAIQFTLTYLKEAQEKYPLSKGNNTVEHLEVMDLADLPLVTQPNLVLSVQPSHLLVGYDTLDEEVGPIRAKDMFPFQTFLDVGATLGFGTDVPVVVDVTPLESLYYAVARKTTNGLPEGEALMSHQKISIADALVAHTSGAAAAISRDDVGTICVGKRADLAILSDNILHLSNPQDILNVQVHKTILNGDIVYQKI
ncbi:amidohydrolase family protein [Carnobacteriaceae bacterium zg-ZUI78]|nr:amidohydrolase family protein [Carnobacteriaceae bacterium zg-ZUI78]